MRAIAAMAFPPINRSPGSLVALCGNPPLDSRSRGGLWHRRTTSALRISNNPATVTLGRSIFCKPPAAQDHRPTFHPRCPSQHKVSAPNHKPGPRCKTRMYDLQTAYFVLCTRRLFAQSRSIRSPCGSARGVRYTNVRVAAKCTTLARRRNPTACLIR